MRKDLLGAHCDGVIASTLAQNLRITGHPQGRVATGNGALAKAASGSRGTLTSGWLSISKASWKKIMAKLPRLKTGA